MTSSSPLTWFNAARYGLFIHWGPYSAAARGEWVANREVLSRDAYRQECVERFTAAAYRPDEWAQLARDAGMGYVVLTTRHHDGFCLWDTDTTEFKATRLGPKRDLLTPYVRAIRAAGLKVGFYFSVADWFHPDYPEAYSRDWPTGWPDEEKRRRFVKFYAAQLEELMTRFGKIDLLWYDGCIPAPTDGAEINARIKQWQPEIVINDRNGAPCDYHSCEQAIKPAAPGNAWEACMTLNDNWGYHAGDQNWKSPGAVIRLLLETAASGGNLLLNIGPRADGTVPERSVAVLREVGDWLRRNPGFLPHSGRSPFSWNNWGRITVNDSRIFLHIFNSPGPELRVPDIANRVRRAYRLETGTDVPFVQTGDRVVLPNLPVPLPDPLVTTLVLEVDGTPATTRTHTSFWIPG